jgi:hypothetical protein
MLSKRERPIGNLMQQYWIPFFVSSELEPMAGLGKSGCCGEDLIAFRNPNGRAV